MRPLNGKVPWILVDKPKLKNIIGSKWVLAIKRKPDGTIKKYKAILVAQENTQKINAWFAVLS